MAEEQKFSTYLAKANEAYMPMIERQMAGNNIAFSDYAKRCVMNAIGAINQMLDKNGLNLSCPDLDQSNLTTILLNVAHLELNPIAQPSECYFQIRNVKVGEGKYKKQIEMGIQGDGFDAILSRFGRGVQKVYPHWLVRENDGFTYPKYNGLEYTPPQWEPRGTGKVVRVVYPVLHTDNTLHFYIGERDDVLNNLLAHINNNLMNETFGIAQNRYKATPEQLNEISRKKAELKAEARKIGWAVLDDERFAPFISPSWKEDFSRESMIVRKIRNNIVKKIPKDFGAPEVMESYSVASEEIYANSHKAIEERAGVIDVEPITDYDGTNEAQGGDNPRTDAEPTGKANAPHGTSEGAETTGGRRKPSFG